MSKSKILIVDDEKDILALISDIVDDSGYKAITAKNSQGAFDIISEEVPEAVILDIWLKDSELDGLGILEFLRKKYPNLPIIMISGHGNIETALKSLKLGAYDYIEKPFKEDKLINVLNKAVENFRLIKENEELKKKSENIEFLLGESISVKNLRLEIDKLSKTESRIFLEGEIGSGKEEIARIVHNNSRRSASKFYKFDINNYEEKEVEQVLFGTEDSGDLNSPARRVGLLEVADESTLYINEICDMPKECQKKLVKFLTDGKFTRVGGKKTIEANVRIISSTNRDLQKKIADGEVMSDLYHRLNVVELKIPSLNERREDIPELITHINKHFCNRYNFAIRKFTNESIIALQSYDWPGNVRQLSNIIEWLLITNPGEKEDNIKSTMLPKEILSNSATGITENSGNKELMSLKLRDARQVFERQYLLAQINRFGGNISRTASFVGMERSALHRKLKSLELGKDDGETGDASEAKEIEDEKIAS